MRRRGRTQARARAVTALTAVAAMARSLDGASTGASTRGTAVGAGGSRHLVGRGTARAGDGRPGRAVGHPGHVAARGPTGREGPRCLAADRPRVGAAGLEPDGDAAAGREVDPVVLVLEPLQVRGGRELAGSGLAAGVDRLDGCRLGSRGRWTSSGAARHGDRRGQDADDEERDDRRARELAEGAGERAGSGHGHPRVEVPARPPDRGARAPAGGSHHCGALRRGPQPYAAAGRAPITPWSWSGLVRVGQVRSGAVVATAGAAVSGAGTRCPRTGTDRSRRSRWPGSAASPSSTSGASRSPCRPSSRLRRRHAPDADARLVDRDPRVLRQVSAVTTVIVIRWRRAGVESLSTNRNASATTATRWTATWVPSVARTCGAVGAARDEGAIVVAAVPRPGPRAGLGRLVGGQGPDDRPVGVDHRPVTRWRASRASSRRSWSGRACPRPAGRTRSART